MPTKEIEPQKFKHANGVLKGFGDVPDLPCYKEPGLVVSCWKIPLWQRLRILLAGKIFLMVAGTTHPPVTITTRIEFTDGSEEK